jgi:DNA-binding NtrC family response regulator
MQTLEMIERKHILFALATCNFNITRTAKELDIGLRTLQRKLKKFGYDPHSMKLDQWLYAQPIEGYSHYEG